MNLAGYIALAAWVPLSLVVFALVPPTRAAIGLFVMGFLFLPQGEIDLPGMIDIGRNVVMSAGVLLGLLLFDSKRLTSLRPRWFDLPMIVYCVAPMATSLSNGLGAYDGLSAVFGTTWGVGVPYLVGRACVTDPPERATLALAIVVGALLYIPFCLYEIRMSPTLHHHVYGFTQHVFAQTRRLGGWRPMVFLSHGLVLGIWMAVASVIAFGLWRVRRLPPQLGLPPGLLALVLVATSVACKSLGAIVLMMLGLGAILISVRARRPVLLLGLMSLAPLYLTSRLVFDWSALALVENAALVDPGRAESLEVRITADSLLRDRALERPVFGWGGWNRLRGGQAGLLTDSLWSVTLSQRGLVGLGGLFGTLFLAQWLPVIRARRSGHPLSAYPVTLALVTGLSLYAVDCMLNALVCAPYLMVIGGLMNWKPDGGAPREPAASRTPRR